MPFKYKPRSYLTPRKKPRMASSSSSSAEIPTVIRTMNLPQNNFTVPTALSSESLSEGLNSEELNRIVNESDPSDLLKPISVASNDFDWFVQNYGDQWQRQHQIIEPIQADGVIQRGPNAPPIIRHPNNITNKRSDPNTIMREIAANVTSKTLEYSTMRTNIMNAIKENITDRGEKYVLL